MDAWKYVECFVFVMAQFSKVILFIFFIIISPDISAMQLITRKNDRKNLLPDERISDWISFLQASKEIQQNFRVLHDSCSSRDIEKVKLLIRLGANVNAQTQAGVTPLHIAVISGNHEIAELLLNNRARPNVENAFGFTPLHDAAFNNNEGMVSLLIKNGAKVNCKDEKGTTPLHITSRVNIARLLLAHGASPHRQDEYGTPLHRAVINDNEEMIKLLLVNGARMDIKSKRFGSTPLHIVAISDRKLMTLKVLLSQCVASFFDKLVYLKQLFMIRNSSNETPRDIAVKYANVKTMVLIDRIIHASKFEEIQDVIKT